MVIFTIWWVVAAVLCVAALVTGAVLSYKDGADYSIADREDYSAAGMITLAIFLWPAALIVAVIIGAPILVGWLIIKFFGYVGKLGATKRANA